MSYKSLQQSLHNLSDPYRYRAVVSKHASELERQMKKDAVFREGYSTGATRQSIDTQYRNLGLEAGVGPYTDYAPFLVYGTRKMEAQDFLRPAHRVQRRKFISDMARAMNGKG